MEKPMSQPIREMALPSKGQAGVDPYSIPLEKIDVSDSELFETDTHWGYFERLRNEDPVHYCAESDFGPYWSLTKFNDIVEVEKKDEIFSSARSITVVDPNPDFPIESGFISMDGPRHMAERKVVQPVVAPRNLARLEPLIRERVIEILDNLPVGEVFDWVDRVSIELTTAMLATLFDFPQEDARKLTFWSEMATTDPASNIGMVGVTEKQRTAALLDCLKEFTALKETRKDNAGGEGHDFVTAIARGEVTRNLPPLEYLGNLVLLIVGGNDTTRNSISGGVLALNENPVEYQKLRDNPDLIPNMVSEMIRWQTPLAHMRRTATEDATVGGKSIKKGGKVVLWYVSANRDDTVIERANEFLIDRANAKQHLSFGWGVHFCVGSRLAEMQLRVLWEEIMKRFRFVEVVEPVVRVRSCFVKGISQMNVRLYPW
jgi:cytochrome P450